MKKRITFLAETKGAALESKRFQAFSWTLRDVRQASFLFIGSGGIKLVFSDGGSSYINLSINQSIPPIPGLILPLLFWVGSRWICQPSRESAAAWKPTYNNCGVVVSPAASKKKRCLGVMCRPGRTCYPLSTTWNSSPGKETNVSCPLSIHSPARHRPGLIGPDPMYCIPARKPPQLKRN